MKKSALIMLFLMGLMLLASCGKELPDSISNYEVTKGGGGNQNPSTSDDKGIPSENDNPLPTY
jgi:predicted small lipoprotein YifL